MGPEYYSILNKTKGSRIASKTETADSAFGRMKGLIGRLPEQFPQGSGIWIFPCNGIHTFGMRFPIDAAYLDSRKRVVRIYHGLVPYRIARLMFKAKSVLELPAGTLKSTHTQLGDELEFRPVSDEESTR